MTFTGVLLALHRANVQVSVCEEHRQRHYSSQVGARGDLHRPDKLEEGVIIGVRVALLKPSVSPNELRHEDLDLLQGEVEADAHSLTSGEAVR